MNRLQELRKRFDIGPDLRFQPRPYEPVQFNRQLAQLSNDAHAPIRLCWAPGHELTELVAGRFQGNAHAIRWEYEHIGWIISRMDGLGKWTPEAYWQVADFHRSPKSTHVMSDGRHAVADWRISQLAPPRWIVEVGADPWEKEAYRLHECGNEFVFPDEGLWWPLRPVLDHGDGTCCLGANIERRFCWGSYRDPDASDLEYVRRMIQEREKQHIFDEVGGQARAEFVEQETRNLFTQSDEAEGKQIEHYKDIFSEPIDIGIRRLNPTVIGGVNGPQRRTR